MLDFLRNNKKALGAAVGLCGLGVGGLVVTDNVDLTSVQTDGLIGFVALGATILTVAVKAFLAKKAKDKAPPAGPSA